MLMLSTGMCVNAAGDDTCLPDEIIAICEFYGSEYGICPEFIEAVIERESSGVVDAENGSCKGLMQISVRWHMDRVQKLGLSVGDIMNPDVNVHLGVDYLSELFDIYDGDVAAVLMAYNGDSRLNDFLDGRCEMTRYAEWILHRAEQLERVHGK